jgi:hypothetical protein
MKDLIQTNRFCNELHDGEKIIFCKRDYIHSEFEMISKKKNKVILIIGNSDFSFTDSELSLCPSNVHHIFVSNTTCNNEKVTPIPIGVENQYECLRKGHGIINHHIFQKLDYLNGIKKVDVEKNEDKVFASFNVSTNYGLRNPLRNYVMNNQNCFFYFDANNYENFVKNAKKHLVTLSPRGNGIECIRTYELLYLDEIPLVFGNKQEYSAIYNKIYKNLPIIFFDNYEDVTDIPKIKKEIKNFSLYGKELLDFSYWRDLILKKSEEI